MELGMGEIVLVLLVALLVYGGRLPEVAAAVGRSLAELKRGLRDTSDSLRSEFDTFAELDPRRAVRRAWQPPRLTETPRESLHPALADAEPESQAEASNSGVATGDDTTGDEATGDVVARDAPVDREPVDPESRPDSGRGPGA